MSKQKARPKDAKRDMKQIDAKVDKLQKGRQQGSQTGREAYKSNSQDFFRHPGQGMRGKGGGQREAVQPPAQETTGSDTRKRTRPENER